MRGLAAAEFWGVRIVRILDRIPENGWGWLVDKRLQSAVQENDKVDPTYKKKDEWLGRPDDDTVSYAPK